MMKERRSTSRGGRIQTMDIAQASLHARGDELAHALLTAPYPNLCAVAEALLQKRKLRRVDLEALLNGCQENSDASI